MKISNTILPVFQLTNEMSAKAAHKFMANLDYIFSVFLLHTLIHTSKTSQFKQLETGYASENLGITVQISKVYFD